jgi:hypothetical protein
MNAAVKELNIETRDISGPFKPATPTIEPRYNITNC